jgi:hypothetical protein
MGLPSCPTGYNLSDVLYNQDLSVNSDNVEPKSMYWSSDGLNFYFVGSNPTGMLYQKTVGTAYDISTVISTQSEDNSAEDGSPIDVRFNSDGTTCYISGGVNSKIFQYTLSTGWDISSMIYASKSLDVTGQTAILLGFCIDGGTNVYCSGQTEIYQYSITAGDLSTAVFVNSLPITADSTVYSMFWRSNSKLYFTGLSNDSVYELSIVNGAITSGSVTQTLSVASNSNNPGGLFFTSDGFNLWVTDGSDEISEYWVGCP